MIDFKDCPKDESWLLFDGDGNCELIENETMFNYARLQIAKGRLEGYFMVRKFDLRSKTLSEVEKFYINHYGVVESEPDDMFRSSHVMAGEIIRAMVQTRTEEGLWKE